MDPDLEPLITRELHEVARGVRVAPGVAQSVIRQHSGVPRRNLLKLAVPLAAAAAGVVTAPLAAQWLTSHRPSEVVASPGGATRPDSSAPLVPFVVDGSLVWPDGHSTTLPSSWTVNSLVWAGGVVALDVSPTVDASVTVVATPSGRLDQVEGAAGPVAVRADGRALLARERPTNAAPDQPAPGQPAPVPGTVVVDVASATVSQRLTGYVPVQFVGLSGQQALVTDLATNTNKVWDLRSGALFDPPVAQGWTAVAVDPLGGAWLAVSSDRSTLGLAAPGAAKRPMWTIPVNDLKDVAFSADGRAVLVSSAGGLTLHDRETGGALGAADLPAGGWSLQAWEAPTVALVRDRERDDLRRCDLRTLLCTQLPGRRLVATSTGP